MVGFGPMTAAPQSVANEIYPQIGVGDWRHYTADVRRDGPVIDSAPNGVALLTSR
jgi:hypothetical protein